jgi:hypothetical protein
VALWKLGSILKSFIVDCFNAPLPVAVLTPNATLGIPSGAR